MRSRTLLAVAILALLTASAPAADWPQFRGPHGLGIADDRDLPVTWGPGSNLAWKIELAGAGSSSPIVIGDRIFLTDYTGYGLAGRTAGNLGRLRRHLLCMDRKGGKLLWRREVTAVRPETRLDRPYPALHGYASSTPTADAERVYVFFGRSGVLAYDHNGKQLLQTSVGIGTHGWGSGTSPVLYRDLVIVNASVESGELVALKKVDGKIAWRKPGMNASWSTPFLVDVPGGRTELVISVAGRLRAFDPQTGADLWNCQGIDGYVCPTLTAHDGIVYAIGTLSHASLAVRAGGKGDVSDSRVLWRLNRGSNVSSPLYHIGHLYWTDEDNGTVYCVDAAKGKLVYAERLRPEPGRIDAAPVLGDGKLYIVSREHGTYVVHAGPAFKQLAHNTLDTGAFNASPAVSNGQILLRSNRALYCIGKK